MKRDISLIDTARELVAEAVHWELPAPMQAAVDRLKIAINAARSASLHAMQQRTRVGKKPQFDYATVDRLYADGRTPAEIAAEIGCHVNHVYKIVRRQK